MPNKHPHFVLQFFTYTHLPPHLRAVSEPFCHMAHSIAKDLPDNEERAVCLRKLLEAKDAAVRCAVAEVPAPVTVGPSRPLTAEQTRAILAGFAKKRKGSKK